MMPRRCADSEEKAENDHDAAHDDPLGGRDGLEKVREDNSKGKDEATSDLVERGVHVSKTKVAKAVEVIVERWKVSASIELVTAKCSRRRRLQDA
jgi:hypothetical protein